MVVGCPYWLIHRALFYYSFTELKHKKIYIFSVLAFFCVCAVSESSYMTILTIFCFHLKSSPPPDPEFAFIGLLTSSWTLGEWDVTFPPPVTHNDAVASDSPADARLSKPAYQWRLIPLYSLHASRMASSMLATANASLTLAGMMYTAVRAAHAHKGSGDVLLLWYQTRRNLQQITSF